MIIAHRGASARAPENTLAAFELAIEQGAHGIELDAKLTRDGQVVVLHDPTVDRTTDGSGRLKDFTLAALRELDAGSSFDPHFAGERIPTLEEVFAAVGTRTIIDVELTNYASPGDALVEKVVELIRRFCLEERIFFSSFLPLNLVRAHRLLPQVPCGLLALSGIPGRLARSWMGSLFPSEALIPPYQDIDLPLVEKTHHQGKRVYAYTVDDPVEMRRLIGLGVDALITDDPAEAGLVLGEM